MSRVNIHLVGNAVADPELRFTPAGAAVAKVRVAVTERRKGADGQWENGDSVFLDVVAWRQLAENIAEIVAKGAKVIVTGRLKQRSYETSAGEKRTVYEVEADDVGVALSKPAKSADRGSSGQADDDPWAAASW